jgi:uncharacterized protein YlxW (UPF0749 family)
LEPDGQLRAIDAKTGKRYVRPNEAQAAVDALKASQDELQALQERIHQLDEELARLRGTTPPAGTQAQKGKGRRRKP